MVNPNQPHAVEASLFQRSLGVCQRALESVGLDPDNLTEVVISGGTARIPAFLPVHLFSS